ncbi:uncharacterized protein LOC106086671 [Stomoxys calcitrans]|uniref:Cytochrome oxidase complex assembly protein 1 n=1 Tax=Stomoxys calcitrans TaxID=35570 RepID=A0A1I8P758_STOCA|nr:uncharacterized protein LOC106086671 [Stomoxys calcitrans]XP_059225428.1 uncharacterized protein LOC106086671 [Stomoxys calcitrans]
MGFPSNKTLAKWAVYIGVAGMSSIMYMRWKVEERISNTDYFRSAFQILRQHKGAVSLLGEPIKNMGFDIGDANNACDGDKANFEVSVKGSKERGKMFFWATRNEKDWLVDHLELELKSQPDKRFIIKSSDKPKP